MAPPTFYARRRSFALGDLGELAHLADRSTAMSGLGGFWDSASEWLGTGDKIADAGMKVYGAVDYMTGGGSNSSPVKAPKPQSFMDKYGSYVYLGAAALGGLYLVKRLRKAK